MKFKVCPQCGSENIEWIIPQNWSQWSCNDCSYTGLVIEVDKKTQEEIQKNWKEHKHIISAKDETELSEKKKEEKVSDKEVDEKLDDPSL